MLVCAIVCYVVLNDSVNQRFDVLRRNQVMTWLDNHSKDLANFILVMRGQVAEHVRIELKNKEIVSSNQSTNQSKHEQLDIILIIRLF